MRLNKLFALFSLTLLSIGTPITRATQAVAMNQNTPPISAASDSDTKNTKKQEAVPEAASEQKAAQQKKTTATNDEQADETPPHPLNKNRHPKAKLHPQKMPPLPGEMPHGHLMLLQVPCVLDLDSSVRLLAHHGIGKTIRLSVMIK